MRGGDGGVMLCAAHTGFGKDLSLQSRGKLARHRQRDMLAVRDQPSGAEPSCRDGFIEVAPCSAFVPCGLLLQRRAAHEQFWVPDSAQGSFCQAPLAI